MWRCESKPLSEISFWLKRRKDARDLERYQFALRSLSSASLVCWHPRLASPASLRRLSSFTRASTARKPHEPSVQDFLVSPFPSQTSAIVVRQNVLCVIMRLVRGNSKKH